MKKILLACLVLVCLTSCFSISVTAQEIDNLEDMSDIITVEEGFFSQFLGQIEKIVSGYFTACTGSPILANVSYVVSIIILLFVATLSYRFYRPTTYVYGAALGFVLGFTLCSILDGPEWLLDAAPFFNWAFAILFAAGAVVLSVFFSRFAMSLFLATTLTTVMACYVTDGTLLFFVWLCSLVVLALAMKSFFIPIASISAACGLSALLFGTNGLIPLTSIGTQLGFQGGAQPWIFIAIVLSVAFIAIQSKICRGTKYY